MENRNRIVFFFLLFVLSSMRMFGQTTEASIEVQDCKEIVFQVQPTEKSIVSIDTQIDFVSWFMGSRQSQMNENEISAKSKSAPTKKQILTSGITPNKVLYRTFMKRVISADSAIA